MTKRRILKPLKKLDELLRLLNQQKRQYLAETELPAVQANIIFEGRFDGVAVVWNASIVTLDEYAKSHAVADDPMQFIEIRLENGVYFLEVGLNVAQIDHAVVERTIIMIRNYKRLRFGRHEYGPKSKTKK